jgi:hypothetical protein
MLSVSSAAPVPRPPQPTRPISSSSLPAAWALWATDKPPAKAPLTATEVLMNSRREDPVETDGSREAWLMEYGSLPMAGRWEGSTARALMSLGQSQVLLEAGTRRCG